MKNAFTLSLLLVSLTVLGCTKKESVNVPSTNSDGLAKSPTVNQGILGSWNWYVSIGGISGSQVLTPASEGYTVTIVYNSDSTFQYYRNDTLQAATRFSVCHRKDAFTHDTMDVITYESNRFVSQAVYVVTADSLELRDECYDCMGRGYTRAK